MFRPSHSLAAATLGSALALALVPTSVLAADGDVDRTFSGDGRLTTNFGDSERGEDLAVQPDGKIVVVGATDAEGGDYDFAVARYTASGSLDPSFGGGDGKVITGFGGDYDQAYGVAIQDDGKIVVAGTTDEDGDSDFAIARYEPDGDLDHSFSDDGKRWFGFGCTWECYDDASDVAIQDDGKIVIVGNSKTANPYTGFGDEDFAVARLHGDDGDLDSSFSFDGRVKTGLGGEDIANGVALQEDGRIVVVGDREEDNDSDFAVARYTSTGALDSSFAGDGKLSHGVRGYDHANAVAVQADGKLVVAGKTTHDAALVRYRPDGSKDSNFGAGGVVETSFFGDSPTPIPGAYGANDIALQADGRIVIAGGSGGYFVLARYDRDGALDRSFGSGDGKIATDFTGADSAHGLAIQRDQKIVAAGVGNDPRDFAIARYLGNEPPETQITGGPAQSAYITDTTPTFSFGSPDRYASFECALSPGGPYFACRSAFTTPVLADGAHYFFVRAKETSGTGQRDPSPAWRIFTVDTQAPETEITSVDVNSAQRRATIGYDAVDPDPGSVPLSIECKLDDGAYRPCDYPQVYEGLGGGRHVVKARATDKAGNVDPTPAREVFDV
jgi:uncharacterized delta-60 repeat protein